MNKGGLALLFVISSLLLILFILALFALAPIFSVFCYLFLYLVFVYFTSDQTSRFHSAQENENCFWTIIALFFSANLMFAKDSPLPLGVYSPTLGVICIVVFTYAVHLYDRHLHRVHLARANNLRRNRTTVIFPNSTEKSRENVNNKVKLVRSLLDQVDTFVIPSVVNNYFWGKNVMDTEKRIISIFRESTPDELNYLIHRVRLGLLFYKIKNHAVEYGDHQTQLVELLVYDRLPHLKTTSRALLLDALQKMSLTAYKQSEIYCRYVLLNTKADELSNLKSLSDVKGDFHSLHKLIYQDITTPTIRQEILNHIKKEASFQEGHMQLDTRIGKERRNFAWRKILSDVDDTLTCSAGTFPAGIDERYPKKTVYPGVIFFYRELDLGTTGPESWMDGRIGNLCFLSARPHVYKDMSEKHSYLKFKKLTETHGMHTLPTMLAGSLESGREFMLKGKMESLALKKFANFEQYLSLYPEFKHIFVADNGQGDVRAAELMIEKYGNSIVQAVFIHKVQPLHKTYGWDKDASVRWKRMNIHFFENYVEAAYDACLQGLIRPISLVKIAEQAKRDFESIDTWTSPRERELRRGEINESLLNIHKFLKSHGLAEVKPMLHTVLFPKGSYVLTPYGYGVVRDFRERFNMYKIELWWGLNFDRPLPYPKGVKKPLSEKVAKLPEAAPPSKPFRPFAVLQLKHVWSPTDPPKKVVGIPAASKPTSAEISRKRPQPKPIFRVKEVVLTPYGCGVVHTYRSVQVDATSNTYIYEVHLQWGMGVMHSQVAGAPALPHQSPALHGLSGPTTRKCVGYFNEASLELAPVTVDRRGYYILSPRLMNIFLGGRVRKEKVEEKEPAPLPSEPIKETTKHNEEILAPGTLVTTRFGAGFVLVHRPQDGILEIQLAWQLANGRSAVAYLQRKYVTPEIQMVGKKKESLFSFLRLVSPKASQTDMATLDKKIEAPQPIVKKKIKPGLIVQTPFGTGKIIRFRKKDEIAEVLLTGWALSKGQFPTAYVNLSSITPTPVVQQAESMNRSLFGFLRALTTWTPRTPVTNAVVPTQPEFTAGVLVRTTWGVARVVSSRSNETFEVEFDWVLSNKKPAKGYLHASAFSDIVAPPKEAVTGQSPLKPSSASKRPSRLSFRALLPTSFSLGKPAIKAPFEPGAEVTTPYGNATVVKYRFDDHMLEVALEWTFKDRNKFSRAYLRTSDVVTRAHIQKEPVSVTPAKEAPQRSIFSSFLPLRRNKNTNQTLPPVYEQVVTPFGTGSLVQTRLKDGVVEVELNWKLRNGAAVRAFLKPSDVLLLSEQLKKAAVVQTKPAVPGEASPKPFLGYWPFGLLASPQKETPPRVLLPETSPRKLFLPGQLVSTVYGPACVVQHRPVDDVVEVQLAKWVLCSGLCAVGFFQASQLKEVEVLEAAQKQTLQNPVEAVGALPTQKRSLLSVLTLGYYPSTTKQLGVAKETSIQTAFGVGRVKSHRVVDNITTVELISWTLANGHHPLLFMSSHVQAPRVPPNELAQKKKTSNQPEPGGAIDLSKQATTRGSVGRETSKYLGLFAYPFSYRSRGQSAHVAIQNSAPQEEGHKFALGSLVPTCYGDARVVSYRTDDLMYSLKLEAWNASLFATEPNLSRMAQTQAFFCSGTK